MKSGPLKPGSASAIKYDTWVKIYENNFVQTTATTITITGLDSSVDKEYRLFSRLVNNYNGGCNCIARLNNVSTSYGYQYINGGEANVIAGRGTTDGFYLASDTALGQVDTATIIINAIPGYVRTAIFEATYTAYSTTAGSLYLEGLSWNVTSNITSISISTDQTNGIGSSSSITLWKRAYAT